VTPRDDLRARVAADLRPVRPLLAPWKRTLLLVPAAALAFAAAPGVLGIRSDVITIGALLSWGGSLVQLGVAVALIAAAMREAVPGEAVAGSTARLLLVAGLASIALLALATNIVSPEHRERAETFADWLLCWRGVVLAGLPLLLVLLVLVARGLPMRPALAGALAGMGAGAAVDGGWRLYCNYSNPSHVLSSHGGAVLALTLLGLLAGVTLGRLRQSSGKEDSHD
jgi:hypothetical protein